MNLTIVEFKVWRGNYIPDVALHMNLTIVEFKDIIDSLFQGFKRYESYHSGI